MNKTNPNTVVFGANPRPLSGKELKDHTTWMAACIKDLNIHHGDHCRVETLVLRLLPHPIELDVIRRCLKSTDTAGHAFLWTLIFCHDYSLPLVDKQCQLSNIFWAYFQAKVSNLAPKPYGEALALVAAAGLPPLASLAVELARGMPIEQELKQGLESTLALYPRGSDPAVLAHLISNKARMRTGYGNGEMSTEEGRRRMLLPLPCARPLPQQEEAPISAAGASCPLGATRVEFQLLQRPTKRRRHNVLEDEDSEEESMAYEEEEEDSATLGDSSDKINNLPAPLLSMVKMPTEASTAAETCALLKDAIRILTEKLREVEGIDSIQRHLAITTIHLPLEDVNPFE